MIVEQRHVTHINLADGKQRDIYMVKDGRGCKLCLMSKDEVVNIYLSHHDYQQLRQEVLNGDKVEMVKEYVYPPPEPEFSVSSAEPYVVRWSTLDWLAYN